MSQKANPTLIGAFVLIALALAAAALMLLGQFKFKEKSIRCVAYFSGSMRGLDVGAPVAIRGVTIGRVSGITLEYDAKSKSVVVPVYMDLQERAHSKAGRKYDVNDMRRRLEDLIDRGLKAQLQTSSLLTGKLYVELSLRPHQKPSLYGAPQDLLEIPTVSSGLDKITETLEQLPLEEILQKMAKAIETFNQTIGKDGAGETIQRMTRSAERMESILANVDKTLPAALEEARRAAAGFGVTMREAQTLLRDAQKQLNPAGRDLRRTLAGLQSSTNKLDRSLNNLERMTAKDSDLNYQLRDALREVDRAAASARELLNYLRRNPNAVLFGKGKER